MTYFIYLLLVYNSAKADGTPKDPIVKIFPVGIPKICDIKIEPSLPVKVKNSLTKAKQDANCPQEVE